MKKIICVALIATMLLCAFSVHAQPANGGYKIGWCTSDSTNPIFIGAENALREWCERDGNQLMVSYFETDASKFIEICENFLAADVDIMIVQDPNQAISEDVLSRAKAAGIVVCTLDTDNQNATYVQKDQNAEMATLLAEKAIDYINTNLGGTAKIVSYNCPQSEVLKVRHEVFYEKVLEACPGSEVVTEIDVWNVNSDWVGLGDTSLQAAPDAYVIFSVADVCTLGALEAYEAADKSRAEDGYAFFSFDALDETRIAIAEDDMLYCSIYQALVPIVQYMYDNSINTLQTGEIADRYAAAELIAVTAENVW